MLDPGNGGTAFCPGSRINEYAGLVTNEYVGLAWLQTQAIPLRESAFS